MYIAKLLMRGRDSRMNLSIDITTIILAIILGHLFSAILGFSYMVQRKKDTVIYVFLLARMFDTVGWIMLALQTSIYHIGLVLTGNTFLILGHAMQVISFLKIKNHYNKLIRMGYFIISVVSIALLYLFTLLYHANSGARITIMSSIAAIMWCYPEYILLKDKNSSILQKVIVFVYGGELILLFLRAYVGIKFNESMNLLSNNIYNILFFIGLYIVMLMGNIGFILMAKEKTDLELMNAAKYDELTGIFNRREFLLRARSIVLLCEVQKKPLSFLMIDLDHFKKINDVYGHAAGDIVLKNFAQNLKSRLRKYDLFGRFGGEEFTVLLPETDEKLALDIAERLRKSTENSTININENTVIKYTISIGIVTVIPDQSTSVDTLYKSSDDALYIAKMNGRNRVETFKIQDLDE